MKYISIDTETTGLDENNHQIIEFAAIIEDTNNPQTFDDIPKFRRVVLNKDDKYIFSSFAASLNKDLMDLIAIIHTQLKRGDQGRKYIHTLFNSDNNIPNFDNHWCYDHVLGLHFSDFLLSHNICGSFVMGGKNVGFDKKFIQKLPTFFRTDGGYVGEINYRHVDPTMSYIDWLNDNEPPSMGECKQRAKLPSHISHKAIEDAWDVILLIRNHIQNEMAKKSQLIL